MIINHKWSIYSKYIPRRHLGRFQDLMRGTSAAHLSVPEAVEAPKLGEVLGTLVDKIGNYIYTYIHI